jgi:hypothetical protein
VNVALLQQQQAGRVTVPPEQPPTLLLPRAVDVSNYTSALTVSALNNWRNQYDIGLVIVQSLDAERFPHSKTVTQLLACQMVGIATDIYVYPFFANGVGDCAMRLNEARKAGVPIRRVWLDVEDVDPSQRAWTPSQRIDMVRRWLEACDAFPASVRPAGVYSGRWYWASPSYMDNSTAFSDRPLWDSDYDGVPDVNHGFTPYGGWTSRAIKQHIGSSVLGGVSGVDQNVLSEAERALA